MMPLATLLAFGLRHPALAHQTEIAQDIGATLHIEPNDIPSAGDDNLAWFALTRRGGEIVPLEACNCRLTLYALPEMTPLSEPSLEPISAEGYENIPGATISFPEIGAYELVLTGTPKIEGDFQPFEFRFEVTVATNTGIPQEAEEASPIEMRDETSADNATVSAEAIPGTSIDGESMATESDSPPLSMPPALSLSPAFVGVIVVIGLVLLGGGILWRMKRNASNGKNNAM